ncbi:MAG: restriction endonuclease subunit S [Candidatus Moraniibacteriota bacterium]
MITLAKTKNIPKLRFPGFSDEWEEKKIKDLFAFKQGIQASVETQLFENIFGTVRFIRIIDITQSIESPRFIKDPGNIYHVRKEDLFMVRYGTPGLISIGYEGVIANNLFRLIPEHNKQIDTKFYYYKFKQLEKNILALSGSSSMPAISFSTLNNIKLPKPILAEQQRVAEFLSSVDEWISDLRGQKESLEKYKKGMMQKIFSQEIRFKDENGKNFPEWEEKKLGDIGKFWNGKAHEQEISENGKYIVINSKFISQNGKVKKYSNSQNSPLKKDDVAIVMSDIPNGKAIGKCFLVDKDNFYTLNQRIGGIKSSEILSSFLIRILSRNKYFLKFDNGVSQTNLRKDDILRCPVVFPIIQEQQKISEFLGSIDNLIESKQQQITQAEQWKKGLMQGLFV